MEETPMDATTGAADTPGQAPRPRRNPQSCRWGESTLYQTFPEWLSAWDSPWSCRHPVHTGPLETVDTCTACRDFRPRDPPDPHRRA